MKTKPKLIVLGGSFNPPTLAHKKLMTTVMQAAHAEKGLYVPSSDTYVSRKAKRNNAPFIFSEIERYAMLKSLCDEHIDIDICEYGDTSKGRTHTTLLNIQKRNPNHSICFIMGSDKLKILPKWKLANMLDRFYIVVIQRGQDNAVKLITENLKLAAYAESFIILPKIQDFSDISSSKIQKLYADHAFDQARHYVTEQTHDRILTHINRSNHNE